MNSGKFTFLRGHLLLYHTMEITARAHAHTHICSKLRGLKPTKEPEKQTVLPLCLRLLRRKERGQSGKLSSDLHTRTHT